MAICCCWRWACPHWAKLCALLVPALLLAGNSATLRDLPWRLARQRVLGCFEPEVPIQPAANLAGLETTHVAYSGEGYLFMGILTSMISIVRHSEDPSQCALHLIINQNHTRAAEMLVHCFTAELAALPALPKVVIHTMRPLPFDVSKFFFVAHATLAQTPHSWVRFYLHDYLPTARRAIWLDTDVIVKTDLGSLYRTRMATPLAATVDLTIGSGLNSGVVVMELWLWRLHDLAAKVERVVHDLAEGHIKLPGGFCDQNVFNFVFKQNYDVLDWRWNVVGMGIRLHTLGTTLSLIRKRLLFRAMLIRVADAIFQQLCLEEAHIQHMNWGPKYWINRRPDIMDFYIGPYIPRLCWDHEAAGPGSPPPGISPDHASLEKLEKIRTLR